MTEIKNCTEKLVNVLSASSSEGQNNDYDNDNINTQEKWDEHQSIAV